MAIRLAEVEANVPPAAMLVATTGTAEVAVLVLMVEQLDIHQAVLVVLTAVVAAEAMVLVGAGPHRPEGVMEGMGTGPLGASEGTVVQEA